MEAEPSRSADGDRSGRQEQQQHVTAESSVGSCPSQQPQQPPNPRPVHRALGRLQNRQPKRTDLLLRLQQQQAVAWQQSDTQGPSGGSFLSMASQSTSPLPSTSFTQGEGHGLPSQSSQESQEVVSSPRKGEKKPQKPGKYVCTFCGRACAKPSVLQKHIRSHTGERPYPCVPCGFSFKTKSNLYKHRKSHAHRIKAGLASSRDEPSLSGPEASVVGEDPEEHTEGESTESEEETGQHRKSSSKEMLILQRKGGKERLGGSEQSQRPEDSQAVKQRLALRLSERKRGPMASPDDPPSSLSTSSSSSLGPGSKGSTESGYFSGSGSTDLSQASPPSSSAKSYAEIILGKYGRLGGQQRSPHQQQPHSSHSSSSGTEDKSIPFAVPKTQVIEHITKLITINEAVVDTSEIDSVKPRRSSLSRKSSMESPKFATPKELYALDPKGESAGPSSLRQLHSPEVDPRNAHELSTVPLLRSHSMPSSTSQEESHATGSMSPRGFRLCQSFDEQQAVVAEMRVGHAQRMLRRQPAIEVPLGTEMLEDASLTSSSTADTELTRQPLHQQMHKIASLFECGTCGAHFQNSEGQEAHRSSCRAHERESSDTSKTAREDRPLMMHYKFRALAMAVRKRRKEESLEEDPPSPGSVATSGSFAGLIPVPSKQEHSQTLSGVSLQTEPNQQQQQQQQQERKGVSVIQHTSSFEKQESISMESQESDLRESPLTQQPQPKPSPSTSRLIRQPNIQVPEILVTVEPDADMPSVSPPVTASLSKEAERVEEFQWPQRSQTLAQLPAEKLPPKKKRLRLAEVTQSSGESSFESMSLPRSPSQESNISSLSLSFEDSARPELAIRASASSSQSSQMLMVPSASHQHHQTHKEMRRSASEQTPASPQQTEQISETRSKSFDYGSLSPQQTASSWKERRKCLLVKHPTLGEPEADVGASMSHLSRADSPKPGPSHSSHPPPPPCSTDVTLQYCLETTAKALQPLEPQFLPHSQDVLPLRPRGQQTFPTGSLTQLLPVTTTIPEVMSAQVIHRAFLHSPGSPPIQINPTQIHMAERFGLPLPQLSSLVPFQYSSRARASEAMFLPFPPRLTTHFPSPPTSGSRPFSSLSSSLTHQSLVTISYQPPRPVIATCLAQLTPVVSLMVPVRLQTHIPTYASAMYTTLSQILTSTRSHEPSACTAMVIVSQVERDKVQRTYLKVPSPDIKSLLPLTMPTELASGSEEGYGALGAGGSKRMLSPAASLELSTEAHRHQKRVKEEEEGEEYKAGEEKEEVEDLDAKVSPEEKGKPSREKLEEREKKQTSVVQVTTVKVEEQLPRKYIEDEKEEKKESSEATSQKKEEVPVVEEIVDRPSTPSYPSLHTSTTVNWCYLKYVKPNPSAQRDPRNSVYSTWSISSHNPNLPGLSTKVALSLLCSKQKHSSETYTMATAQKPALSSKLAPGSSGSPRVSEVHATSPSSLTEVKDQRPYKQEDKKEKREEQGPSTSKHSEPSRVRIFEGGYKSNEEYVYVRGRGRGKYICGECGIRCKKPSMLKKHIRTHTDVRPYVCKHCNFAFKTKGNLTKHMKSKAHGKKCQAMGVSESSLDEPESEETVGSDDRVCGSEEQEEHQFSDVEESDDDDDDEDDDEEESASHEDPPSSCSSDTHLSTGGLSSCSRRSKRGTPDPEAPGPSPGPQEPSPRGVWPSRRAPSPGSRRALFSRRGWKASPRAFSPSSESCSPSRSLSPRLELSSPIHSLSPRTELSSPSRHVSPSPERGPSPIRPLSPVRPISPSYFRSSQSRASPSPLGLQPRMPGYFPWESPGTTGSHMKLEKSGTSGEWPASEPSRFPSTFRLSPSEAYPGHQAVDNIFSHLPMHSQQAKVPYLMIPIGGIQMVQARPRSHPTTPSSPTSPPLEGPSLARFESYWGGTPRTQGLRTPGDHWSEHRAAGTSQSGWHGHSTVLTFSKPEMETTDSKQYGSSHSSLRTRRSAPETTEHCPRDSRSRAPLSQAAPVASCVTREQPESEEPALGSDVSEEGAKGDSARTDQST
ncbi:unnamed protein product [Ophioblennius macclurei]